MSILVFTSLAIGFGIVFQRSMEGIVLPSLVSGIATGLVFHGIGYVVEGRFDSLVMVSVFVTTVLAFAIALGIGAMMRRAGKKRGSPPDGI